jgi:hypothetical protein
LRLKVTLDILSPYRKVERRFQKAFPELGKIRGNAVKFPTEIRT